MRGRRGGRESLRWKDFICNFKVVRTVLFCQFNFRYETLYSDQWIKFYLTVGSPYIRMLGGIQFCIGKTQRKIISLPLGRISRASGWTQDIMVGGDARRKDQRLSDMVTSKIRLKKGFWSTKSKLLFRLSQLFGGKQNQENIFKMEIQVNQNALFYHGESISAALTKKLCSSKCFDSYLCRRLLCEGWIWSTKVNGFVWVTHRRGIVPRKRDQLLGMCIFYPSSSLHYIFQQ